MVAQTDHVLLLHGLAAGRRSMRPLERALRAAGYGTLNLAYPSCRLSLGDLVRQVHACGEWARVEGSALQLVTCSMGGLLAGAAIAAFAWPIGAVIRWRHRQPLPFSSRIAILHRLVRIVAVVDVTSPCGTLRSIPGCTGWRVKVYELVVAFTRLGAAWPIIGQRLVMVRVDY